MAVCFAWQFASSWETHLKVEEEVGAVHEKDLQSTLSQKVPGGGRVGGAGNDALQAEIKAPLRGRKTDCFKEEGK